MFTLWSDCEEGIFPRMEKPVSPILFLKWVKLEPCATFVGEKGFQKPMTKRVMMRGQTCVRHLPHIFTLMTFLPIHFIQTFKNRQFSVCLGFFSNNWRRNIRVQNNQLVSRKRQCILKLAVHPDMCTDWSSCLVAPLEKNLSLAQEKFLPTSRSNILHLVIN